MPLSLEGLTCLSNLYHLGVTLQTTVVVLKGLDVFRLSLSITHLVAPYLLPQCQQLVIYQGQVSSDW